MPVTVPICGLPWQHRSPGYHLTCIGRCNTAGHCTERGGECMVHSAAVYGTLH